MPCSLPVRLRPRGLVAFDFLRENILNTALPSAHERALRTNCTFRWIARVVAQHPRTIEPKKPAEEGGLSSMSESKSDATYTMGRTQGEEDRLIQQSQLYDAVTRRFFREAGISSGMKVLDIGSGAGDVALTAAELVGPARGRRGRGCKSGDSRNGAGTGAGSRVYQRRIRRGGRPDPRHRKRFRRPDRPASPHVYGRSRRRPETASDPPAPRRVSRPFKRLTFTPYRQMPHSSRYAAGKQAD